MSSYMRFSAAAISSEHYNSILIEQETCLKIFQYHKPLMSYKQFNKLSILRWNTESDSIPSIPAAVGSNWIWNKACTILTIVHNIPNSIRRANQTPHHRSIIIIILCKLLLRIINNPSKMFNIMYALWKLNIKNYVEHGRVGNILLIEVWCLHKTQ